MRDVKLSFATDADGVAVVSTDVLSGCLFAIEWVDGSLADGVDATFTVTGRASGITRTILTLTDANDDAFYHLGAAVYGNTGATITGAHTPIFIDGKVTATLAAGGSAKTGGAYLFLR